MLRFRGFICTVYPGLDPVHSCTAGMLLGHEKFTVNCCFYDSVFALLVLDFILLQKVPGVQVSDTTIAA
jgi:hypothetical protein